MRNEEWAKLTRVVHKYKVKVSTERSDFAAVELARNVVGANSVRPLLRICCNFRNVGYAEGVVHYRCGWRVFCGCRILLLPWACSFDGRTVFAPTILLPWVSCFCRFIFNFQAANEVQEVLFCAIRDFTSASPIHVDRMFPHALLPRRIFDLG